MKLKIVLPVITVFCLFAVAAAADLPGLKRDFTYKKQNGSVDVLRNSKVVARYVYNDTPKPYIYPVLSQNGVAVTQASTADHPEQRSFWIGFGDVNGVDFWNEGEKCGKIVQTNIDFEPACPGYWAIHTKNDWIGPDGSKICEDERRVSFLSCNYGTVISTMLILRAPRKPVSFGDTKDGFFAFRMAQGMQVKDGTGHITNSESAADTDASGKRAKWCDYTGEVDGKTAGITIFDAPLNNGHPTYWNVQDYGLFAANPFGGEAFTGDPKRNSALRIAPYDEKVFVYIALIHDGKFDTALLNSVASEFVGSGPGASPIMRFDKEGNPEPMKPESK